MECFNGTFKEEALHTPLLQFKSQALKEQNEFIRRCIEFYDKKRPCSQRWWVVGCSLAQRLDALKGHKLAAQPGKDKSFPRLA